MPSTQRTRASTLRGTWASVHRPSLEHTHIHIQLHTVEADGCAVWPHSGQAEVEGSRFFAGGKGAYWIADEPGSFKFTLNNKQRVKSGDTEVLPEGRVFFNARIRPVRTTPLCHPLPPLLVFASVLGITPLPPTMDGLRQSIGWRRDSQVK